MVAGGLPPLLPTPMRCISLTPPPTWKFEGTKKQAGCASSSLSWVRDKLDGGGVSLDQSQESWSKGKTSGGGASADGNQERVKILGRASLSSSWVADKMAGRTGNSTSGVDRAGRPMWRGASCNGGKRTASRAPSADRTDKKAKPPMAIETEAVPAPEAAFAGPSFILSPGPSSLPMPTFLLRLEPSELPLPTLLIHPRLVERV